MIQQVPSFDSEIETVVGSAPAPLIFTSRSLDLLNYYLRYPGGSLSGWKVYDAQRLRGFALLTVRHHGGICCGKIVDCFLDSREPSLWQAAFSALTQQLREQAADYVTVYATTSWVRRAIELNGFYFWQETEVVLRDPQRRMPREVPFMLTMLEADHAIL